MRTLIVDDEPLARERLIRLLSPHSDVQIIRECSNGLEAVDAIQEIRPDLVFLDVQMPELDGFGVLATLEDQTPPAVIFTTAYDQFAVKAFEVHAVDYLLKPFDGDRLAQALERVRRQFTPKSTSTTPQATPGPAPTSIPDQIAALLAEVRPKAANLTDRISVKVDGRILLLKVDDVDWIEAADNYVNLHVGKANHLLRDTLSAMESRLDTTKFVRISRSLIVNVQRVKELHPLFHGDYTLVLHDGTRLNASRNYREKLREAFGV